MINMNDNAIEYIRDVMGYEDVVVEGITYKTWCDPPRPEISVSFTDDSAQYYADDDYLVEDSPIGKVFIRKNIDVEGASCIRYEKHPWIEQFEFDGLHPRTPLREGYGNKTARGFVESLSKIYARAYDDYVAMCSEEYKSRENEDGFDAETYFSNAAHYFVQTAGEADSVPMFRKFCGFTENMWREGTKCMHDIALEVVLPIIAANITAASIFNDVITSEFAEYIKENGYSEQKCC